MSIFQRRVSVSLDEIHTYVQDLDRLTLLRDKEPNAEDRERLANIVEVASKVLERLLERVGE